ncbi:suppressor of glycerol defect [Gnomoniopsis smithogilvyi]|uniref:Suppressor of glycerol defect n=1 Tax=Gnomoniopsis smithogilvyi TaxID=1191159 RepID=A0A9W8YNA1_9PEZI|nr:suppressor of glycerol defect [Gnomoniopsis smithogilvyi]
MLLSHHSDREAINRRVKTAASRTGSRNAKETYRRELPSGPVRKPLPQQTAEVAPAPPQKSGKRQEQLATQPYFESDQEEDDFGEFPDDQEDEESEDDQPSKPVVSKATKEKLSKEDAEIAELERKLGIKNRKALPKSFQEDGLGDILGDLNENDDEDNVLSAKKKRKAEADEWLAQKRRKAMIQSAPETSDDSNDELDGLEDLVDGSDMESNGSLDEDDASHEALGSDEDDQSLQSDGGKELKPARKRENPYVAPVISKAPLQKYIPPARRQESGSDAELLSRIRRQTQGLINRLTEPNLLIILGDIEKLYREYPRQHVTSILIDLVLVQICEPTSLPDTLLILYAGFSTAAYQVIGPDFGAQLVQQTVERFSEYHAQLPEGEAQNVPKYTSNLITFMSQIYNFQLIGCTLIFDYVRILLNDLSELNAELLLRIVRMAGQALRRDDPLALKDIVALIGPAVKKVGEVNLSVRTKFLIESINDLKNNKVKTGASASAIVQEHTTRIKKLLGSLNARKLKATEPIRIGLKDIEDSDKRGKWWLVGASWTGRQGDSGKQSKDEQAADGEDELDSIILGSDDEAMPDLHAIAREQNMNTDVRRSIFIAIMSSSDYEDAYARLMKLRLNKHRQKEIAYVVMQCVGCEQQYNPYYSLVARRVCGDSRIKFAFQDSLWKFLRRLGESPFGEDADDEEEDETIDARRILSVAKMFGFLIANGALGLSVLKCLSLAYVKPKARDFVEVLLNTLFLEVEKAGNDIAHIFGAVADMQELSKGLQYFLKKRTQRSELVANKKDGKKVKKGAQKAIEVLSAEPQVSETVVVGED